MLNFKWRHFQKAIILAAVRWYCAYPMSYRHIEELMDERGIKVDHSTINRWVIKYAPDLERKFRKCRKKPTGSSWRMDETYVKVKGAWHYLYRAVDKNGNTIDFMLSKKRDKKAALKFFIKAIGSSGMPDKVTIDKSGSNKAALDHINLAFAFVFLVSGVYLMTDIRQIKYLNNIVEQDHRRVKRITKATLGFKSFEAAKATIAGAELYSMLKKNQHIDDGMPAWQQFYALAA